MDPAFSGAAFPSFDSVAKVLLRPDIFCKLTWNDVKETQTTMVALLGDNVSKFHFILQERSQERKLQPLLILRLPPRLSSRGREYLKLSCLGHVAPGEDGGVPFQMLALWAGIETSNHQAPPKPVKSNVKFSSIRIQAKTQNSTSVARGATQSFRIAMLLSEVAPTQTLTAHCPKRVRGPFAESD